MEIDTLKETLVESLMIQAKAVSGKSNIPVLSNVLLKADTNKLYLYTTNLEMNIISWIAGDTVKTGSTTVVLKRFLEYINTLPAGNIKLKFENNELHVLAKHNKAVFTTISAEEFPKINELPSDALCSFNSQTFFEAINIVAFSASKDETKPTFTGIFVEIMPDTINFVAIDGFRLSKKTLAIETGVANTISFIIPSNYLEEIAKLQGSKEEDVKLYVIGNKNQIGIRYKNSDFMIRLIDGVYPEYNRVIPQEFSTTITLQRQVLVDALKSSSIFTSQRDISIAQVTIEKDAIVIKASQKEIGESESRIECQVSGETGSISYNSRFLQECILHLSSEEIVMKVVLNQDKPTVFFNTVTDKKDASKIDESYFTLMTPIKS